MERVDVAIVGGGPAGSSAGRAAAAAGADAVIFERGIPREDREGLGPDSTDAAGFLDYWLEIADLNYHEIPRDVILQSLSGAEFIGPSEQVGFTRTAAKSSYPGFGFTFHRARFDDWLCERAEEAGAEYRLGTVVRSVDSESTAGGYSHTLTLRDGSQLKTDFVILADGPQRTVTIPTLDQFTPDEHLVGEVLNPRRTNHVAYQEYRRFPEELFDPRTLKFWWGWMPGETAYPWVFPNEERIARVGLTTPIGLDLDEVSNPGAYRLLSEDDEYVPRGDVYIRRLLEEAYPGYCPDDFPLVEDRGKDGGTETYPISSTRPIDSPTKAGIAVAGGAMGTTSPFHEGGDHVAIRTGELAGRLAAQGRLEAYNDAWKAAIGDEVLKNSILAAMAQGFEPHDWDRTFRTINRLDEKLSRLRPMGPRDIEWIRTAGRGGLRMVTSFAWHRRRLADGGYVKLHEDKYTY